MARNINKWSQHDAPFFPPPWAWVNLTRCSILLSIIVSMIVPIAEEVVIPLWLLRSSLSPFPFQMLVILPLFHCFGMFSSVQMVFYKGVQNFDHWFPCSFQHLVFDVWCGFIILFLCYNIQNLLFCWGFVVRQIFILYILGIVLNFLFNLLVVRVRVVVFSLYRVSK